MTTPIPSPPSIPFLGNATSIDKEVPVRSYILLARQYGEIYQLNLAGYTQIVVSSYELLNEVSNQERFYKKITPALMEVRNATGDALFTAHAPGEENWYIAHRILMPAFSATNVRNMFDDMYDITSQLVLKWERFGPGHVIDPAADFTRLTLDAITFCSMSYRLNSFYSDEPHPFATAMTDFLAESGRRSNQPGFLTAIKRSALNKYEQDQKVMLDLVDEILNDRREHPIEKNDLLNIMLFGKDKETGKGLPDDNIKRNLVVFLIAGHETTSGTLTFIIYYLLKNPDAMRKLREEIDEKIGDRPMTVNEVNKLPYLLAVIRETMRLAPTVTARGTSPINDTTVLNGKYAIPKDTSILISIAMAQRDPKVWGEDAGEFRPERMLDGKFEALPPNAWQPFGFGMRACIGRAFAWQEMQLVLVAILQRFDLVMHDPSYSLELKSSLTVKPKDFKIHAIARTGKPKLLAVPSSTLLNANEVVKVKPGDNTGDHPGEARKRIYVLYGSNTGSSETFAQRIASDAASHGFCASIGTMDSATEHIPTDGPVIIVTASFEGEPADNAAHFVSWLSSLKGKELKDVAYGVFGCGNRDWVTTYQKIPKLCDEKLSEHGGKRLVERGEGDASGSDFFEAFDIWEANLFNVLHEEYGTKHSEGATSGLSVETLATSENRAKILRQDDADFGTVITNKLLTAPNAPQKRHIVLQLPAGYTYQAGDYLAILPSNPERDVHRALAYFGIHAGQEVIIKSVGPSSLPVNKAIPLHTLLSEYVELSQPATSRDLRILLDAAKDSEIAVKALNQLLDSYADNVVAKRLSVLDILEDNPIVKISLGTFLQLLPSMRIRQYSISSSPLADPQQAALTISVIEAPAISGRKEPFLGVASNYLANLRAGDKVQMAVRTSNTAFHPPSDPTIPMIMFCAGAGLAPMRGFLQERALQKKAGREVAKNLLFFGCRNPQQDYLYSDTDLKEWIDLGIVDVRPAFSRASDQSAGCKYVQDRVWHDREDLAQFFVEDGAKLYLCGAGKVLNGIKDKLVDIIGERKGLDKKAAAAVFTEVVSGRFATDVFE
ncbi:fatty acid hydroxylase [Abortiporus biennis]|nr:fatty acid hydroxylase [Abortiporus biennis]